MPFACRLSRCTLITTGEDGPIPRCKPFKYTYEKEIVIYPCNWKAANMFLCCYFDFLFVWWTLCSLNRVLRMLISRSWTISPQNVMIYFATLYLLLSFIYLFKLINQLPHSPIFLLSNMIYFATIFPYEQFIFHMAIVGTCVLENIRVWVLSSTGLVTIIWWFQLLIFGMGNAWKSTR